MVIQITIKISTICHISNIDNNHLSSILVRWHNWFLYSSQDTCLKTRFFFTFLYFFNNDVILKNLHFQKKRTFKISYFQNLVLSKFVLFAEFRAFFKTSVFLKIPRSKVHLEFPRKIPCFFQKFPVQKKVDFTNSVFFSKNSVFYKIPRFSDF